MYHVRMNIKGLKDSELLDIAPKAYARLKKHGVKGSCDFFEDPKSSVYIDPTICKISSSKSVWVFGLDKQIWWGDKLTALLDDLKLVFMTDQVFLA